MELTRRGARLAALAVATILAVPAAAGAQSPPVTTPDGALLYHSSKALVSADKDTALDLYVWDGRRNRLATPDTAAGVYPHRGYYAISADGTRVVFTTGESLSPADTDAQIDIYERSADQYRLVSTGPADSSEPVRADLRYVADGGRIIFETPARLVPEDAGSSLDVYAYSDGTTSLVSGGSPGGLHWAQAQGVSPDGTRVYFGTGEALVPSDRDNSRDIYERDGSSIRLVSTGTLDDGITATAEQGGLASDDGSSFIFGTGQRLEPGDVIGGTDWYQRKDGRTRLITANSAGLTTRCNARTSWPFSPCAFFIGTQSRDGGSIAFDAGQPLTAEDTNEAMDFYLREGGSIRYLAPAPGDPTTPLIDPDGRRVVFVSKAQLDPSDTNEFEDLYEWESGRIRRLTTGARQAVHGAMSIADQTEDLSDLSRVFLFTHDAFAPEDTDGSWDIYEAHAGGVRLVSTGPADDHVHRDDGPGELAVPADGSRAFFRSEKQLVAEDTDSAEDVYQWRDGVTTLVSRP